METTRIKCDEKMMVRCLAKLSGNYRLQTAPSKPAAVMEAEVPFKLDIPPESLVVKTKAAEKSIRWEDFKKLIQAEAKRKSYINPTKAMYTFKWDKPPMGAASDAKAAEKSSGWSDFSKEVDSAL